MLTRRLDNGLTVIIKQVPNKVVTLDIWVNTGSANELDNNNGISHFLEHMMFKGTSRHGAGELDKIIMNVGGVWNAGTSKDFTHYYVTVASPYFDTALDAISDMIQNSLIDKLEFDREKLVILEEYRRKQDSPFGLVYDELSDLCYDAGPYKRSVLGSFESISRLDRDDMFDYYQRYYTADNTVLIIVGDVEPETALAKADRAFVEMESSRRPLDQVDHKVLFASNRAKTVTKDVQECYLALAYPAPGIDAEAKVFAMDIASTLLGDGRSSRLNRRVKEERRLVNTIAAGYSTSRFPGMFYVLATLDPLNMDEARSEIDDVITELSVEGPTSEELAKAKRVIRNGFLFGTETNTGQSSTIGYYYTLTGGTDFLDSYLDRLESATADQVQSAVTCYLTDAPSSVLMQPNPNHQEAVVFTG